MSFGFITRDAAGNIQVNTSDTTFRRIAVWTVTGAQISGALTVGGGGGPYWYTSPVIPGLVNDGTWFVDAPGTTNIVEFIGGNRFRIAFIVVYMGYSDIPVTVWKI